MTTIAKGGRALSDDIAVEIAAARLAGGRSPVDDLGPRETEILRLVARGKTTEEIAALLALSAKTVQNYHYQIKSRIGAKTDAHLVWLAIGAGLVDIGEAGVMARPATPAPHPTLAAKGCVLP